jgi:hypothetical protein
MVGDEIAISDRLVQDRLLQYAIEDQPTAAGAATVDAKDELGSGRRRGGHCRWTPDGSPGSNA